MSSRSERLAKARTRRKRKSILRVASGVAIVLVLAVVIWLASGGQAIPPMTAAALSRVSPDEAHQLMQTDEGVLYDVRSRAAYEALHAAGALSLPEAEALELIDTLPDDQLVILY